MTAYYNEIDPYAAAWLRNLIDAGHIAPGIVDERSIEDVTPADLAGFTQCHFFAGIGVWSLALRSAGWPDSRPAWTGSCPCQPFSAAGKGAGFDDERHLWPAWQHLIAQCRPAVVFGEQVASKAVDAWIDLVHADMEGMGYAFGGIAFPSAGVGAPHVRDRTFWVADSKMRGCEQLEQLPRIRLEASGKPTSHVVGGVQGFSGLGHANGTRLEGHAGDGGAAGREGSGGSVAEAGVFGGLANAANERLDGRRSSEAGDGRDATRIELERLRAAGAAAGPTNGFWRAADWLGCTDGKWRPVEPSTFPLAHGATSRVGRLRAYGNAINAQAAQAFIESYCEARGLIDLAEAA
jgi:DNA (cytosine-5)-methyltransferase 1